ncbi:MAG: hypothetical protein ABFS35_00290 [Bacteroidota bacterium]
MHPIDKKNKNFAIIILTIAVFVAVFCIFRNKYYLIALAAFGILALANTLNVKHRLVLMGIFVAIGFPVILVLDYYLSQDVSFTTKGAYEHFWMSFIFAAIILITPFFFAYAYFIQIIITATSQKIHYAIIEKYPYLICTEHYTRTRDYTIMGYRSVRCRKGKKCLRRNKIGMAVRLVGLIGLIENDKLFENDYYVTLWDHRSGKIRYGDYDVIEIHNNEEIKDYNFVISKIITFFYNEIDRYKLINEVSIRVVGDVPISENTKRLLEQHFLKVEYLTEEL